MQTSIHCRFLILNIWTNSVLAIEYCTIWTLWTSEHFMYWGNQAETLLYVLLGQNSNFECNHPLLIIRNKLYNFVSTSVTFRQALCEHPLQHYQPNSGYWATCSSRHRGPWMYWKGKSSLRKQTGQGNFPGWQKENIFTSKIWKKRKRKR